jgi:hypothetical protein
MTAKQYGCDDLNQGGQQGGSEEERPSAKSARQQGQQTQNFDEEAMKELRDLARRQGFIEHDIRELLDQRDEDGGEDK